MNSNNSEFIYIYLSLGLFFAGFMLPVLQFYHFPLAEISNLMLLLLAFGYVGLLNLIRFFGMKRKFEESDTEWIYDSSYFKHKYLFYFQLTLDFFVSALLLGVFIGSALIGAA